jgi:hypothetical protein
VVLQLQRELNRPADAFIVVEDQDDTCSVDVWTHRPHLRLSSATGVT